MHVKSAHTLAVSVRTYTYVWIERAPSKSSAKFKSANIFVHTGWGQSAKFNARQIFRLYGNTKIHGKAGGLDDAGFLMRDG